MKPIRTYLFEGEPWEDKLCRGCKKEFSSPVVAKRVKCRNCKLKLNGPLRPYKKKEK